MSRLQGPVRGRHFFNVHYQSYEQIMADIEPLKRALAELPDDHADRAELVAEISLLETETKISGGAL